MQNSILRMAEQRIETEMKIESLEKAVLEKNQIIADQQRQLME